MGEKLKFGVSSRLDDMKAITVAREICFEISAQGHEVIIDERIYSYLDHLNLKHAPISSMKDIDIFVSMGGDGTLLERVHELLETDTKALLLGVKYGHIGFLCEVTPEEFWEALAKLEAKNYNVEERRLLSVTWQGGRYNALNDILITPSRPGKTVEIIIKKDDDLIYKGRCDGVLISTSLGSTAYLASRGGPIIDPELDVMIVDVMNPLLWGFRTLILPIDSHLRIVSSKGSLLIVDGMIVGEIQANANIEISGSENKVRFVRFNKFYDKVRKRAVTEI
ncbi:MAG: NAD(+)/NADH kinase [Thermoprotei archaeon]